MGAGIFVGSALLSLILVTIVLVKLPEDYFDDRKRRPTHDSRHPLLRFLAVVGKNLIGVVMVAVGVLLSVPGVPGQGFLTVLLGLMLIDFPGKYRIERAFLRQRKLLKGANAIRSKFGKPKFTVSPRQKGELRALRRGGAPAPDATSSGAS